MKKDSNIEMKNSLSNRRRGAMLVLVAITIVLLIIAVAFSVDAVAAAASAAARSSASFSASTAIRAGSAARCTRSAVSRISRIGSSSADFSSLWNPLPIFLNSEYA